MVNLDALAPGIRVKIVDEWKPGCGQNVDGLMDKYLGQIVTILDVDVDEDTATIEGDSGDCRFRVGGHWAWNSVDSDESDFEPSSESEILSFIFKE